MSEPTQAGDADQVFSVDTLLKYMGNDDKAYAVVGKIVRDAAAPGMEPLEQAGAAIREQRLTDASRILHSLRGSVGSLGAKRLVQASLRLERALAEAAPDQIPAFYAILEQEYRLVLDQADDWLRQHAA
ncbi:Hpt domain-containing protein [Oxalobacteraceae bacterium A2-2]